MDPELLPRATQCKVHSGIHHHNELLYFRRLYSSATLVEDVDLYLHPYIEQQPPCGQLPQTVLPLAAPHVPSLVGTPLSPPGEVVGTGRTGSCVDTGAEGLGEGAVTVQPF